MKKWSVLFLVSVLANTVFAGLDYRSVCDQLNFTGDGNDRVDCYVSVEGSYVQQGAINVCKQFHLSTNRLSCIVRTLDKTYSADELKLCASKETSFELIKCMQESGTIITGTLKCDAGS